MGFFDQTVDTFEVYNQPLYAYPEVNNLEDIFIEHILGGEDFDRILKRHLMFRLNLGKIRRVNRYLGDGTYPYGRPIVSTNFKIGVTSELQSILDTEYGESMTVEYVRVGSVSNFDWITSELNKPWNHEQGDGEYEPDGFRMIPDIDHGENVGRFEDGEGGTIDSPITSASYSGGVAKVEFEWTTGIENEIEHSKVFDTNIGPNPNIEYWIVGCAGSSGVGWRVWQYDPDTNQYPQLEIPDFFFGSEYEAEAFPAVPVRLKNIDFTEFASEEEQKGIKKVLKPFGVKPQMILDEVFAEDSGVDDPNTMDNIFVNFGVRVWDESQSGREYLYEFFKEVFYYLDSIGAEDANTNCIETMPDAEEWEPEQSVLPEDACHAIHISTDHTEFDLFFASVKQVVYSLDQVNANEDLSTIYYSDSRNFDSNNLLTKEYHSSSGELLRAAEYTAHELDDIIDYLGGGGEKSPRPSDDGRLKPAVRIGIDPIFIKVYDENDNFLALDEIIPEDIYEKRGTDSLTRLEPIGDDEDIRKITYYHIFSYGMTGLTVYGIGGQTLVEDTETSKSRLVQLYAGSTNKLTVPVMFGLLENRSWANNNSNFAKVRAVTASLHMSVYVADVTTTRLPWWGIVLKVIGLVLTIISFVFPVLKPAAMMARVALFAIAYIMVPFVIGIVGGSWFGQAIAVVIQMAISYAAGGNDFSDILANIASATLPSILITILNLTISVIGIATVFGEEREKEALELLDERERDLSNENEISKLLTDSGGNDLLSSVLLKANNFGAPKPMDPEKYFAMYDDMPELGSQSLEIDNYLIIESELPGMAA